MQSEYEERFLNEKNDFDKLNEEIFLLQQKLYEKESVLVSMKKENGKLIQGELKIKEIYIADPTRLNNELNNELNYARDIMAKVSKMLNAEKRKNENLEKINKEKNNEINKLNVKLINLMDENNEFNSKFQGKNNEDNKTEKNNSKEFDCNPINNIKNNKENENNLVEIDKDKDKNSKGEINLIKKN